MGGKGSGGRRPGAGRKKKTAAERFVDGNAGHRGRVLTHPSAPEPPAPAAIDEFDVPDDLTVDERNVWLSLAPHAFKNRTLTKATALAFKVLCRNIVLERRFGVSVMDAGSASHRGLIQRVDAELEAFGLRPVAGKPMADAMPAEESKPKKAAYW